MDKHDALDLPALQIEKQVLGFEMGQFADQQVERFLHQRRQVIDGAKVGAVRDAHRVRFEQETVGGEALGVVLLESAAQALQVSRRERRDANVLRYHGPAGFQGLKLQPERQQFIENVSGIQHLPDGRDAIGGQMDWQILPAFFRARILA